MMQAEELMRRAIEAARRGMASGQSPFGCAISIGGTVVAAEHNRVFTSTDITAHAEITALREACRHTKTILLEDAVVASTCEPCPMCMSALHWARVDRVYFGAAIEDAAEVGFNELRLSGSEVLRLGGSSVKLIPGILREECQQLFADWRRSPNFRTY